MMNNSAMRHITRLLLAMLASAVAACTDPTAIGPAPEFVRLSKISSLDGYDGPDDLHHLPPDSCPVVPAAPTAWTRRALGDEATTVALPPGMLGTSARFSGRPGSVFDDAATGLVAFGYDDDQPLLYGTTGAGGTNRYLKIPFQYSCSISVDGRPATLIFGAQPYFSIPALKLFGSEPLLIIRAVSPTGRHVNALVALHPGAITNLPGLSIPDAGPLLALARVAASLQW